MRTGFAAVVALASYGAVSCAPQITSVGEWSEPAARYFEAESGALSGGFFVGTDDSASAGEFLAAPELPVSDEAPGDALAEYEFSLPSEGIYTIWARIRSPGASSNRYWIRVDEEPWFKWRISVGDIWYWDDLHEDTAYSTAASFELASGNHRLAVAFAASGAELDRFYLSALGDVPAGNETSCDPPHSIELDGICHPSCGSQSGTLCGLEACSGRTIFAAYDCDVCCR